MNKILLMVVLATLCVANSVIAVAQNSSSYDEKVKDLLLVEEELRNAQKQNEERREEIALMEKKVKCTYDMLKSYESCEEKHEKDSDAFFSCINTAKQNQEACLTE
ncbi:hypothetical protein [Kaarinaea lacus]